MLKFLRKYNKVMMVVFGCFLMVVFLMPGALNQIGRGQLRQTVARLEGKPVRISDIQAAQRELQLVATILPDMVAPATRDVLPGPLSVFGIRGVEHWMLLVHEARALGLVGGPRDGQAFLRRYADAVNDLYAASLMQRFGSVELAQQIAGSSYEAALNRYNALRVEAINKGNPESVVDGTLAKMAGVLRLADLYGGIGSISRAESVMLGRDILTTAVADVVILPAKPAPESEWNFDEEAMAAHFEKYKDKRGSDDPFGIGYLRPDAVKLEWIAVRRQVLVDALRSRMDPIAVNKLYRQNQAKYGADFNAAKSRVEEDFLNAELKQMYDRASESIKTQIFRSVMSLPSDGQYKVLPPDWAQIMPPMAQLAASLTELLTQDLEVAAEPVIVMQPADWLTFEALGSQPDADGLSDIGQASLRVNESLSVSLAQLVMNTRELAPDSALHIQQGMIYGPLTDPQNNLYYVRILDTRPEGPPADLAEVADAVRRDMALLAAYERISGELETYRAKVVAAGGVGPLMTEVPDATTILDVLVSRSSVSRDEGAPPSEALSLIDKEVFRTAVADRIASWDPKADISTVDADQRAVAVAVPEAKGAVVAFIKGFRPLTAEQLRENGSLILSRARQADRERQTQSPLSFEAMVERHRFEVIEARSSPSDSSGEGEAAAGTEGESPSASQQGLP